VDWRSIMEKQAMKDLVWSSSSLQL
jgi:hypothetical protein